MNQDRQGVLSGELDLSPEIAIFGLGLVVVPDLADRDHAVLLEIATQERDHAVGDFRVVRLLGVERQGAKMTDPELLRTEPFPAEQRKKIVLERSDMRSGLPHPECRLDDRRDPGRRHRLVVVGRARGHVDMGVKQTHPAYLRV